MLFWSHREITRKESLTMNVVIITIPLLFTLFYPNIGTILGYVGAITGLLIMYILPVMVHLKRMRTRIENPMLAEAIDKNAFIAKGQVVDGAPASPKLRIRDDFLKKNRGRLGEIEANRGDKKKEWRNYYIQCALHSVIPVYGVLILFFQFYKFPSTQA
jgi:hypothetical protein